MLLSLTASVSHLPFERRKREPAASSAAICPVGTARRFFTDAAQGGEMAAKERPAAPGRCIPVGGRRRMEAGAQSLSGHAGGRGRRRAQHCHT